MKSRSIYDENMDDRTRSIFTSSWEKGARSDGHGRPIFPRDRENEFVTPSVSRSFGHLYEQIEYPCGKKFALVLTHDIDLLHPSTSRRFLNSLSWMRKGRWSNVKDEMGFVREHHPYSDLEAIARKEESLGANSTFFFMNAPCDGTGAGYPLHEIQSQADAIKAIGSEIGLHGSYNASGSAKLIMEEKLGLERMFGAKVEGYRNHFLRFKVPETWKYLSEAGVRYDSTLGFADNVGFRNGMVHPYNPEVEPGKRSSLIELPLAVMDSTLYSYMGLTPLAGKEICYQLIGEAMKLHGGLVILWHNTTFSDPRYLEWGDLYWNILKKVKDEDGWLCSGIEMVRWWEENGY
jgi:hypothetical protein